MRRTVTDSVLGSQLPLLPPDLPILVGFRDELLPALVALWVVLLGSWVWADREYFVPLALWATVTTIMLWPVGRRLGRAYLSYRTGLFILGVLSMAYIPAIGFILQSSLPYSVKLALWLLLPVDLTVFAILPSLRQAIALPIRMFFRPDLLFGDGRVLCCGTIALLFGIRYLIGPHPPEGVPVAIPRWNWWGIALAMGLGFIPMIPLRGMTKLLTRMSRLIRDEWYGWWGVFLKETFLALTLLAITLGFHHVFKGWTPFEPRFWEEARGAVAHRGPWPGVLLLAFGYLWLVVVRGGYKKAIGEPFIKETVAQTWLKELLYVPGVVTLIPGLMLLIEEHFGQLNKGAMLAVGIPFFLWGLAMVTGFRVLAQINQRRAIVQQMAAVVLPAQTPEVRRKVLTKILNALCEMKESQRLFYMRAMQEAIGQASEAVREVMTRDRLACLAALPPEKRRTIMASMDRMLLGPA
jgi:hypothetical protein